MTETDKYYIELCLDGQPDEYRHLVRRYQVPLTAFLTGKLADRNLAEEAVQETFVRAYFALAKLKKADSFHSWLLGIGIRVAKELQRNKKVNIDIPANSPVNEQTGETEYELEQAIAELPQMYRELILLRFYAGLSCNAIAEKLDIPVGTVTKQLSRGYSKLRESLKKY